MYAYHLKRIVPVVLLALGLSACASAPKNINNVCSVFDQRDGWMENWYKSAKAAEARHGIPVHVLMATVRKESGFQHNARPKRKWYLGFIPGPRPSTAYGFSQALDGTWDQYQRETGSRGSRTDFATAIDFVGWYHGKTVRTYGVAPNDAFRLYLAYYHGWTGFSRGDWQRNRGIQNYARATAKMADDYAAQMQRCGRY